MQHGCNQMQLVYFTAAVGSCALQLEPTSPAEETHTRSVTKKEKAKLFAISPGPYSHAVGYSYSAPAPVQGKNKRGKYNFPENGWLPTLCFFCYLQLSWELLIQSASHQQQCAVKNDIKSQISFISVTSAVYRALTPSAGLLITLSRAGGKKRLFVWFI